jgi:alkylhydroperoxidase family enzyme
MSHHLASSKRAGVAAEDVQALKNEDFSRFTEAEQAALRYDDKITRGPTNRSSTSWLWWLWQISPTA